MCFTGHCSPPALRPGVAWQGPKPEADAAPKLVTVAAQVSGRSRGHRFVLGRLWLDSLWLSFLGGNGEEVRPLALSFLLGAKAGGVSSLSSCLSKIKATGGETSPTQQRLRFPAHPAIMSAGTAREKWSWPTAPVHWQSPDTSTHLHARR